MKMSKNKLLLYLMIIIAIILAIPSIVYLINNKSVDGFNSYYTYTLIKSNNMQTRTISAIIVIRTNACFQCSLFSHCKKRKNYFQK